MNDNNYYTPQTIAWKLYTDTLDQALSSVILGFSDKTETDPQSYMFELLLSIFCELLLIIMFMDNVELKEELNIDNFENQLNINFDDFYMELYLPIIETKFKVLSHIINIETYDRNDENEKDYLKLISKGRYCRLILKQNYEDQNYFKNNENSEDYSFITNENYQKKNKLNDIFAILLLNDKMYKIYFDNITKIGENITQKMF
jgi:hypothetical protein